MTPLDFILDCHARGLRFRLKLDNKFTLSPSSGISEADRAYIAANRDSVLQELRITLSLLSPCPVCPGATSELCCGGPGDEFMLPDGRIFTSWCAKGTDEPKAFTHRRARGETKWTEIAKQEATHEEAP